jgi:hypothetical protein
LVDSNCDAAGVTRAAITFPKAATFLSQGSFQCK